MLHGAGGILGRVTAWDILRSEGICRLPVDSFCIAKNNRVELLTYDYLSLQKVHPKVYYIEKYSKFAFCYYQNKQYYIAYNETQTESALRYAIMHELAHIFLGHIGPEYKRLTGLPDDDPREQDAHRMARRVLCPSVVLHFCGCTSPEEIAQLCGVGYAIARPRYDHLQSLRRRKEFLRSPFERDVLTDFKFFISEYLSNKYT